MPNRGTFTGAGWWMGCWGRGRWRSPLTRPAVGVANLPPQLEHAPATLSTWNGAREGAGRPKSETRRQARRTHTVFPRPAPAVRGWPARTATPQWEQQLQPPAG